MKLYFFGLLLFGIAAHQVYSQGCHLREIDLCVAIGLFQYQGNGLPPDDEKVNEWCETMQEVTHCVGNFTEKCLSPLQKELMGLLAGSDEASKQFCEPGSEIRAKYLAHAECLAEGAEGEEFKTQLKDFLSVIEKTFDIPFKKRFPLMCCGFKRFFETTEKNTAKRCGEESVVLIRNIMQIIVTDLPDIICQKFDPEGADCKELLPPSGTPPKEGDDQTQLGKLLDTVLGDF